MVLTWKANSYIASNVTCDFSLQKISTVNFTINDPMATGTDVIMTVNGSQFFNGYVTNMQQMDDERYDVEITEYANKLYNLYCFSPAVKGIFKPSIIIRNYDTNTDTKTTIGDYITAICVTFNHSGVTLTPVDEDGINALTEIPGMGLPLPDMTISHETIGKTLRKFIVDTLGLNLWYEYLSTTSYEVHYGTKRETLHVNISTEFIVNNKCGEEAIKAPVIGVYIKNEDASKHGYAGDFTTGPCAIYEIDGSFSENELNAMASKILSDYALPRLTYSVGFPPGTIRFKEGDVFDALGDQTLQDPYKMTWKDDSVDPWQIKSLKITNNETVAHVGNTKRTVFDIYNDILREIDGTSIPKETVVIESDYMTLYPGTNENIYYWYMDPAMCGNVNIKFQMTNFATQPGEVPSGTGDGVYDPSDYVSSSSTLPWKMTTSNFYGATQEKTVAASTTDNVVSASISNIPYNYNHADILAQYTVKSDGEFDINWDCNWSLSQQGAFPSNITPNDLIQSDNSDVNLDYIGSNTTLVQRFYIKAIPNNRSGEVLPDSTITLTAKNNLGTPITLSNIILKPTFFHYVDYPADGTLGGSSSFATDSDPQGDTCYYVKSNGQIIVKITEQLLNVTAPSAMWRDLGTQSYIEGWYYTSLDPDVMDWKMLQQSPNNPLIFTQQSEDNYLTPTEVTYWNTRGGAYFGSVNYMSLYDVIKSMTRISYESEHDGIIKLKASFVEPTDTSMEIYPPAYNNQAYDRYWQSLEPLRPNPTTWFGVWKEFMLGPEEYIFAGFRVRINGQFGLIGTYSGGDGTSSTHRIYAFDTNSIFNWAEKNAILNMTVSELIESSYIECMGYISECSNRYVTAKLTSKNCGKKSNWDGGGPTDPNDPDVFPSTPVGPSYMQYMLNNNNDWMEISSSSSLLYVEKTTTGETEEDYDGTTDQFYIGYKNLNTISYYAPATIAVNCIITYDRFKDTYVYGDYY